MVQSLSMVELVACQDPIHKPIIGAVLVWHWVPHAVDELHELLKLSLFLA